MERTFQYGKPIICFKQNILYAIFSDVFYRIITFRSIYTFTSSLRISSHQAFQRNLKLLAIISCHLRPYKAIPKKFLDYASMCYIQLKLFFGPACRQSMQIISKIYYLAESLFSQRLKFKLILSTLSDKINPQNKFAAFLNENLVLIDQLAIKEQWLYYDQAQQCLIFIMNEDEFKNRIIRKPFKGKQINAKMLQRIKANTSFSASQDRDDKRKDEIERNIAMKINQQSISFIAKKLEVSFISNGQDRSLDSFDKLIIDVDEELDLEDNTEGQELDYTFLYKEFEKFCKEDFKPKQHSGSQSEDLILVNEEEKPQKEQNVWEESEQSPELGTIMKERLQEIKTIRQRNYLMQPSSDPNISIRLLGANLSEIHEQEINHNQSTHPMDPIEEQFIDFVSKGQGPSKINISKIEQPELQKEEEKKVSLKRDVLKQTEEDEVVAMLQNELVSRGYQHQQSLNEDQTSLNKKAKKQSFSKQNYNPILRELQEIQEKKVSTNELGVEALLNRRCQWINSRSDKSKKWKNKEFRLIEKFKEILQNAEAEFSQDQELCQQN